MNSMYKKIFINIFFEKKRILIAFISVFIILLLYVGIQMVILFSQSTQFSIPDVQMNGKLDDDGVYRYKMYNDTTGLSQRVKELVGDEMRVYGAISRNICSIESAKTFEKVNYMVYGVYDDFFNNELKNSLKEGRLPSPGKKEAVIGSYAARYFNVKVGDKLEPPVTLNKNPGNTDSSQYIVTGILNDNVYYFKGAIFISKQTFEQGNGKNNQENTTLIYFRDSDSLKAYDKVRKIRNEIINKYNATNIIENYEQKYNSLKSMIYNLAFVFVISILILFLLISYFMKGVTKKVGLLKALGVSDSFITKTFIGGFGASILLSIIIALIGVHAVKAYLNYNLSQFLGYSVQQYMINTYVYLSVILLAVLLFGVVLAIIKYKSYKISPRDAMLKA